jgi:hypothetical protein
MTGKQWAEENTESPWDQEECINHILDEVDPEDELYKAAKACYEAINKFETALEIAGFEWG